MKRAPKAGRIQNVLVCFRLVLNFPVGSKFAIVLALLGLLATGCNRSNEAKSGASDSANASESKKSNSQIGQSASPTISSSEEAVPKSRIRFVEKIEGTGIEHRYDDGRSDEVYSIVESLGGGLAVVDYDRDGELDLVYAGGGGFDKGSKKVLGKNGRIYRGRRDWHCEDVTRFASFDCSKFYNHSIVSTDYDQDGFIDFLVTGYGGLQLWRNLGDGSFEEVSQVSGLVDPQWSSGAAWGDVDRDGDHDLYVAHYGDWSFDKDPACVDRQGVRDVCGPRDFQGLNDSFYRNLGDGRFEEAAKEIGLVDGGRGLGVLAADLDLDGDVEFYVANDEDANFLYRNDQGKLTEIGVRSGTALDDTGSPDGSMGIALGDYNRDGKLDLFVTHYETETCALYARGLGLNFTHASRRANITSMGNLFVAWGTAFVDFDQDADQDLAIVNGHAIRHSAMAPVDQVPVLLENLSNRSFQKMGEEVGTFLVTPRSARGLAIADFDHDGRIDLATSTVLQPPSLLMNASHVGKGIVVRLIGTSSNRDPIGATVRIRMGSIEITQQWTSGGSYASSSDRLVHFGLGEVSVIEELEVAWPSGKKTILKDVEPTGALVIVESIGEYRERTAPF